MPKLVLPITGLGQPLMAATNDPPLHYIVRGGTRARVRARAGGKG